MAAKITARIQNRTIISALKPHILLPIDRQRIQCYYEQYYEQYCEQDYEQD